MRVTLWREAVLEKLDVGDRIIMTHVKGVDSGYSYQLNSTKFTTFKVTKLHYDLCFYKTIQMVYLHEFEM